MKVFPLILGVSFIISGALALYSECAQASTHGDSATGHEASAIHCPDALLLSNPRATSTIQSHSRILTKVPPSIHQKLDRVILAARFKDRPFWGAHFPTEPLSV